MADGSAIEWTDATWNPTRGCSRVSSGCDNCYAMRQAVRQNVPGGAYEGLTVVRPKSHSRPGVDWSGKVRLAPDMLDKPLRWRKPRKVFVDSMSDLFHPGLSNEEIAAVFGVMAACPQHTFQVLTKRPERAVEWFRWVETLRTNLLTKGAWPNLTIAVEAQRALEGVEKPPEAFGRRKGGREWTWTVPDGQRWPLPNVWLGVSVENQETADERIPKLLKCPAAVRFVSAEPLLGPLDLRAYVHRGKHQVCPRCMFATNAPAETCPNDGTALGPDIALDWVIVGGESGNGARPFHVEWARAIVEQCKAAGAAPFVKQLGRHPFRAPGEDETDWGPTVRGNEFDAFDVPSEVRLEDSHGGDWEEWPEDLRVREFPR